MREEVAGVGAVLVADIGIATGLALFLDPLIATDTVGADDLADYLEAVCVTLTYQNVELDAVIAERPLTIFRSALSRQLDSLCQSFEAAFAQVLWIDPVAWKQQQELLRRYARSRHLVAWRTTKTRHERDALLIGLWKLGVLAPVKSP